MIHIIETLPKVFPYFRIILNYLEYQDVNALME